jgi:DNA (cytosine-5)-methyltransferase 1
MARKSAGGKKSERLRRTTRQRANARSVTRAPYTALDLFSGCGGLTLGLRRAGFNVLGAVEIDALAVETYAANHPDVTIWPKSITKVTVAEVMRTLNLRPGQLDLLAGCPPCQGFSTMKTLNGRRAMRDPRNKLIDHFVRFVRILRPKSVMMENVPRLANHRRFRDLCRTLRKLGYEVTSDVKNAADFGVPQRRRRLILLASRNGAVSFPRPFPKRRTVAMAIGGLPTPGSSGDPVHDLGEVRSQKVQKRIASIPKDGGSRTDLARSKQLPCHRASDGFKDVYGRMRWKDVAPTITGGCFNPSKGRFLHPTENRAITMREAAILQGFPRRYKFPNVKSKQAIALLIGNALPARFITAHAKSIVRTLRRNQRRGHARRATTGG